MIVNYSAPAILIVAALADLLIPVILGLKYPGYDHFRDTISTLGTKESPVRKQGSIRETQNQALHRAAIQLHSIAAGELYRC